MFWSVLGRMLWAQRAIVLTALGCALIGGLVVVLTAAPRYDGTARVSLNLSRPTVGGMKVSRKTVDAYVGSQMAMIRDVQVVGRAIETVGWADNPDVIAQYNARPASDQNDMLTWLAARVAPSVQAYPVDDTDILEIRFSASSPQLARTMAGAIRDAYLGASVAGKRQQSIEVAEVQKARADVMAKELVELQAKQVEFERKTGIILGSDPVDMESQRLSGLVTGQRVIRGSDIIQTGGPSAQALIELDSQIAQASQTLGPAHPQLLELHRRRAAMAQAVTQESAVGSASQAMVANTARQQASIIAEQTNKVLSQRNDVAQAHLLRDEITGKQHAYDTVMKMVMDLRQQANTNDSGLTPVGDVAGSDAPTFPNKALILGGTGGIGLIAGVLIALLVEMFNLRVRTAWGAEAATQLPTIGSVPRLAPPRQRFRLLRRRRLRPVEG
ncbi:MAG: hypothetical protein JF588_03220 [Caulobacterales bacterium]|nr:hypothetical protein [Caulobacterales bacterium]